MTNSLDDQIKELVRDVTQVMPRAKSEVEQRIKSLILQREAELLESLSDRIKGVMVSGVPTLRQEMDKVTIQDLRLIIEALTEGDAKEK